MIALRWLGGQGSEALTNDSAPLDLLTTREHAPPIGFAVRRQSGVSHHAMNSRQVSVEAAAEPVTAGKIGRRLLPVTPPPAAFRAARGDVAIGYDPCCVAYAPCRDGMMPQGLAGTGAAAGGIGRKGVG
jgi:hypothetical protein